MWSCLEQIFQGEWSFEFLRWVCSNDGYTGFTKIGDGFYNDDAFYDGSNSYSDATLCASECAADSGCWGITYCEALSNCFHYIDDPVAGGVAWTAHAAVASYEKCPDSGTSTADEITSSKRLRIQIYFLVPVGRFFNSCH